MNIKVLTFNIEDKIFCIDVTYAVKLLKYKNISPIPVKKKYITGVILYRGEPVPVVDSYPLLVEEKGTERNYNGVLIIKYDNIFLGISITKPGEMITIDKPDDEISTVIDVREKKSNKIIFYININKFIDKLKKVAKEELPV